MIHLFFVLFFLFVFCFFFCFVFFCSWILLPCLYFNSNCSILLLLSAKDSLLFYYKFYFTLQIFVNIFWPIKVFLKKQWIFGISCHNHIFFQDYNDLIKLLQTFWWYYYADKFLGSYLGSILFSLLSDNSLYSSYF